MFVGDLISEIDRIIDVFPCDAVLFHIARRKVGVGGAGFLIDRKPRKSEPGYLCRAVGRKAEDALGDPFGINGCVAEEVCGDREGVGGRVGM